MPVGPEARALVWERAGGRCEYCQIAQDDDVLTFHVDHVVAGKHGGASHPDNLCLACSPCNLHKGSDITSVDPATLEVVRLFNPRTSRWDEHFSW